MGGPNLSRCMDPIENGDFSIATVDGQNPAPVEAGSLSQYLQGFVHPRWCRISAINSMLVYQRVFFLHFPAHLLFCGGKTFELELGRGFVLKNLSQPTHSLKLTAILPRKGNLMFQTFFRGELFISGVQVSFLLLETDSNWKECWESLAHGHGRLPAPIVEPTLQPMWPSMERFCSRTWPRSYG